MYQTARSQRFLNPEWNKTNFSLRQLKSKDTRLQVIVTGDEVKRIVHEDVVTPQQRAAFAFEMKRQARAQEKAKNWSPLTASSRSLAVMSAKSFEVTDVNITDEFELIKAGTCKLSSEQRAMVVEAYLNGKR